MIPVWLRTFPFLLLMWCNSYKSKQKQVNKQTNIQTNSYCTNVVILEMWERWLSFLLLCRWKFLVPKRGLNATYITWQSAHKNRQTYIHVRYACQCYGNCHTIHTKKESKISVLNGKANDTISNALVITMKNVYMHGPL